MTHDSSEPKTITAYLDTALLLRILDGKAPVPLLNSLNERTDVEWIFSPALYDDLVAANFAVRPPKLGQQSTFT